MTYFHAPLPWLPGECEAAEMSGQVEDAERGQQDQQPDGPISNMQGDNGGSQHVELYYVLWWNKKCVSSRH